MSAHREFEEFYRRHAGPVRAYARRRIDASAADDVVAEVFVVAWRRWEEVPAHPLPWLLGVARRVLANQRRGEQRAAALAARLGSALPSGAGSASAADAADAAGWGSAGSAGSGDERVLGALAELGAADRELLMLIAWEGLSVTEAATVLGVRAGTAAVRLHRARQRFARALSAHDAPLHPMSEARP